MCVCVVVVVAADAVVSDIAKRCWLPFCAELDDRAIQIPFMKLLLS